MEKNSDPSYAMSTTTDGSLSRYPIMMIVATDGLLSKIARAQVEGEEILMIKEILQMVLKLLLQNVRRRQR